MDPPYVSASIQEGDFVLTSAVRVGESGRRDTEGQGLG